jgi:hypothetical protein
LIAAAKLPGKNPAKGAGSAEPIDITNTVFAKPGLGVEIVGAELPVIGVGAVLEIVPKVAKVGENATGGAGAVEGANANVLREVFEKATPTSGRSNQLMTVLDDGTKVIFRKDFGAQAHPVGGPFQGKGAIDHYNIEIQAPRTSSSGVKTIENIHLVPDGQGGFTWFGKDGVIKK